MRFQEFWGIASSVAYKPLLKCTQTPSAKFKIRSYVATTYLEFSATYKFLFALSSDLLKPVV